MSESAVQSQFGNWCRHFNGIQHGTCEAGVNYTDVRDNESRPYRWPCFKSDGCTERCSLASFPTPEEAEQEKQKVRAALERYTSKIADNICPHCDRPIESKKQVGRCVYAVPCYHRLYQGQLPKQEKKLHPYLQEQLEQESKS